MLHPRPTPARTATPQDGSYVHGGRSRIRRQNWESLSYPLDQVPLPFQAPIFRSVLDNDGSRIEEILVRYLPNFWVIVKLNTISFRSRFPAPYIRFESTREKSLSLAVLPTKNSPRFDSRRKPRPNFVHMFRLSVHLQCMAPPVDYTKNNWWASVRFLTREGSGIDVVTVARNRDGGESIKHCIVVTVKTNVGIEVVCLVVQDGFHHRQCYLWLYKVQHREALSYIYIYQRCRDWAQSIAGDPRTWGILWNRREQRDANTIR